MKCSCRVSPRLATEALHNVIERRSEVPTSRTASTLDELNRRASDSQISLRGDLQQCTQIDHVLWPRVVVA